MKTANLEKFFNSFGKKVVNQARGILNRKKGGGTKTLPKGSIVFIDDIRGRINPQYRCKDSSGSVWFIRTRFIDMMEEEQRLAREDVDKKSEEIQSDKEQFNYRGGVRVGKQGGDAADENFTHRETGDK